MEELIEELSEEDAQEIIEEFEFLEELINDFFN